MTYAQGRVINDADSHIMELPDFLKGYADPGMGDRVPTFPVPTVGALAVLDPASAAAGRHPPEKVAELVALGDRLIAGPKGHAALGAFDPEERTLALDLFGFQSQLVFPSYSAGPAFDPRRTVEERYAAARAHNRAMADFCSRDRRLFGVSLLPLDEPDLALKELEHIVSLGLKAAWIAHRIPGDRSPGHTDFDPIWARMARAGIPFLLHVAGAPIQVDKRWFNNGRPEPKDFMGAGESVRGKDMTSLHHAAETFIGALVLDGVLERHSTLRGGAIELGAGWVPSMLRRLDWIADIWKKSEPELAALKRRPSQQVIEQLAFTPFPYEDVAALIRESDPRLYMFSSDYPHIEGGRAPIARFDAALAEADDSAKDAFFAGNYARLFAMA
ncbi:amidohydrolase family protein [uncultured Phenylobacterium sp.]|uniref:amidohydrolase family protein n=1 Tax=uncultured Phenylobacterium sp. TaxID=349273 RepID=UPI0025CEADD0|nr:amidohydrolase family protein [uncultured Phenylobacterium sp.]